VLRLPLIVPEERPPDLDERIDLATALDRLPARHLLRLSLYYHLDLPIAEVARVLGCSEGAARVRIHRALAVLRPALKLEEADA
jgi:RNA polymerase sigma factor (sigma-70 family)